jgi:hypothetical protein
LTKEDETKTEERGPDIQMTRLLLPRLFFFFDPLLTLIIIIIITITV